MVIKRLALVAAASLALAACSQTPADRTWDECITATHGLKNTGGIKISPIEQECFKEVTGAEYVARETALTKYREMNRLETETENDEAE